MSTTIVLTFIIMTLFFIAMSLQVITGRKKEYTHTCAHNLPGEEGCGSCTCRSNAAYTHVIREDMLR